MPIDQTHAANERHDKYVLNMAGIADRRNEEASRLLSQAASILRDRSGIEPTSTDPVAPNIVEDTNAAVVRPAVIRLIFAEKNFPPKKVFLLELGPCSSDRSLASFFVVLLRRLLRVNICIVLGIPIA